MARKYWLMKTEPDVFSWDDLMRCPKHTSMWEGVRNYQARNFLRDTIQKGDGVLFYHSRKEPMAIVGTAEVVRTGYPDPTQFDPSHKYWDPKSKRETPTWYVVDVQAREKFAEPLTLARLRALKGLEKMMLLRKGSRLSVQPVTEQEWKIILRWGG